MSLSFCADRYPVRAFVAEDVDNGGGSSGRFVRCGYLSNLHGMTPPDQEAASSDACLADR